MRILALDVGTKRIGVAKADSSTRIAVPVGFINVDGSEWRRIARLATLNNTNLFVLGLPRSNQGTETKQSLYVRNFAKELIQQLPGARIRFQDESLTSVVAEERLKSRKRTYEKGEIDAEAAAIILQDFLETFQPATASETASETTSDTTPDTALTAATATSTASAAVAAAATAASGAVQATKQYATAKSDKIKLNTKKAKHKMKTATKWMTGIGVVAVLALVATGVALFIKEQRYKEYAEQFAQMEAQMEADVFTFTILPGQSIYDVEKNLIAAGFSATEAKQALTGSYDYPFLKNRPEGATLEGYLYGETHEFYRDTSAREVIDTFLKGMGKVITDNNLEASYAAQGLSLYEGITLASIVQKESYAPDMPTVAQVFLTRLDNNMSLGSDVTVSYALDTIDPDRQTYSDNYDALSIDSCYNTRLYRGLPCGPISNPSLDALLAVASPSDTSYLYFLTGDDGLMYYSYTEDEHLQNAALHCSELCQVSL